MGRPCIDLTGKLFDNWTVQSRAPNGASGQTMWWCVCDCNRKVKVDGQTLTHGHSHRCRRCTAEKSVENLVGRIFGDLSVLARLPKARDRNSVWLCQCLIGCGRQVAVRGVDLRSGNVKSCGQKHDLTIYQEGRKKLYESTAVTCRNCPRKCMKSMWVRGGTRQCTNCLNKYLKQRDLMLFRARRNKYSRNKWRRDNVLQLKNKHSYDRNKLQRNAWRREIKNNPELRRLELARLVDITEHGGKG